MRIPHLTPETMTPEQRRVYDNVVSGPRGVLRGPLLAALFRPELCEKWQQFGEILRFRTSLPAKLNELAIMVTARVWNSQLEWLVHAEAGLKAGLPAKPVEDMRLGLTPKFDDPQEQLVYDFTMELHKTRTVSEATYNAARNYWDIVGVVELTAVIGYYTLVSMTLNVHDIFPAGEKPPLPALPADYTGARG